MSNKPDSQPAYFLSLEVENVRCFGPRQKLDVSDGNGRPAQWTVILGDNGVGKTTLLQCLVGMEPSDSFVFYDEEDLPPDEPARFYEHKISRPRLLFDSFEKYTERFSRLNTFMIEISVSISKGASLNDQKPGESIQTTLKLKETNGTWHNKQVQEPKKDSYDNLVGLVCYGYGASRRMRESAPVTEKEE
ncbi:MAG TPA: AAA family ATPase, partial [Acidobacteriota bacterium]|nr:AAA family ATPase [Acidobacteriota bacterium]